MGALPPLTCAACAIAWSQLPAAPTPTSLTRTGEARCAREKIATYKHLSADQKEKLLAALEAKERAGAGGREPGPQELRTEVGRGGKGERWPGGAEEVCG